MEAVPGIDAVCAPRQYTNTKPGSRAAAVGKLRIGMGTALVQSVLLYLCKPSRRFLPKRQYFPVTICLCPAVCVRMKLTLPSSLICSRPKATTTILFYHPAPSSSFAICCTNSKSLRPRALTAATPWLRDPAAPEAKQANFLVSWTTG